MKSTVAALLLLLLFPSASKAFKLSGETGFYRVNLKGDYTRELGLEKWRGRKSGYYYRLELSNRFSITGGTSFKVSVITGTTKVPSVNAFTSNGDSLFYGGVKTFDVKELYFRKRGFLFKKLTLTAGKQLFTVPALFRDYLWGGSFRYSDGNLSLFWNQIASYEGRYLLMNGNGEDDVDIAVFGADWRNFTFGAYRIMDARGNRPAVFRNGVFFRYRSGNLTVSGVSQNGRLGGWGEFHFNSFTLTGGYWQKGITSYGYREEVRNEGLIFRPTIDGMKFGKLSYSFALNGVPVSLYAARFETSGGRLIGNEVGGEVDYPFWRGVLFLKGAAGSGGAYGVFGGYRWGFRLPAVYRGEKVKVKNYFDIWGEYANFPQRFYPTQLEYEGWATYKHVGFWHSTYRMRAYTGSFSFQVATGKNTKFDYIVWGNTADNFLYQRNHGKLWHLEELYTGGRNYRFGLQPVSVKPLFSDYLPGLSYRLKGLKFSAFYHSFNGGRGSSDYGLGIVSYKGLSLGALSNGRSTQSLLAFYREFRNFRVGGIREWGHGHRGDWGAVFGVKGRVFETELSADYRVFSGGLSTFNLREFYRNAGLALRPGERGVRYFKATADTPLNFWNFPKFSTKLRFIYDRLYRFSGSYVAQEFGIGLSLKPGKMCNLELLLGFGSSNLSYTGVKFLLNW